MNGLSKQDFFHAENNNFIIRIWIEIREMASKININNQLFNDSEKEFYQISFSYSLLLFVFNYYLGNYEKYSLF